MNVTLLYFGPVRERAERAQETLDLQGPLTLRALFLWRFPDLAALPVAFAHNGAYADGDVFVVDGDEVAFLPPVGGG